VVGKYYALVIGIAEYDNGWSKLDTPINDVTAIAQLLKDNYGFIVQKLTGEKATRVNIIQAFQKLNEKLGENDNLLIFYAGHGTSLPDTETNIGKGYWLAASRCRTQSRQKGQKSKYCTLD
jgi:uncharacterized caspase-like protein